MQITPHMPVGLKETPQTADTLKEQKLRKTCGDFEAIILRQMLSSMRESVPKSGLLGGDYADKMYQSMRDDELSRVMAGGRGMGLGEVLYKQLSGQSRLTMGK